jgi:hypothetical protein
MGFELQNECVAKMCGRPVSFTFFLTSICVKYQCLYLCIFYLAYSELPFDELWFKVFPHFTFSFSDPKSITSTQNFLCSRVSSVYFSDPLVLK